MDLVSLKKMPTLEELSKCGYIGFPCDDFPSDHLPLCFDLVLKSHVPIIFPV
jgi:hypothetical protein